MPKQVSNESLQSFEKIHPALPTRNEIRKLLVAPAEKHLITIAPTGAGKFRSVLAPELLTYPGPVVCVDIKGEAYAVTARRRRELGQRVVRLDPFQVIGASSDSLNLFDLFKLPSADLETDAQMISAILAGGASIGNDPFWDISAGGLAGLFDPNPYHGGQWPSLPGLDGPSIPNEGLSLKGIAQKRRGDDDSDLQKGTNHG